MPELPEVETIIRYLFDKIINQEIRKIKINCKRLRVPITTNMDQYAQNTKIVNVSRKGKYIIFSLNNHNEIVIHLGMSGKLLYSKNYEYCKHDHIVFFLTNNISISFNDCRRFGLVILLHNSKLENFFSNLGIEPLSEEFTPEYIHYSFTQKKVSVKSILMNNKFVVGIGNIYASEILFNAKISPLRITNTISYKECQNLTSSTKNILTKAIDCGGSTLKDYRIPSGSSGTFQNYFTVYKKNDQQCMICNNIIKKITQNNRSTYYCEKCQL